MNERTASSLAGGKRTASARWSRTRCGDLAQSSAAEWLVTNGRGSYASGTVAGVATRRYHGTLIAALEPPAGRTVLAGPLDEWGVYRGQRHALSTHEWSDGAISPDGFRSLESFHLEEGIPVWTYAFNDVLLEKRTWMMHGADTTLVRYTLLRGSAPLELELRPLLTFRDFHALPATSGWQPDVAAPGSSTVTIRMTPSAPLVLIATDTGAFQQTPDWYRNFFYREEAARGFDAVADLFCPGVFHVTLEPGDSATLAVGLSSLTPFTTTDAGQALLEATVKRGAMLLTRAGVTGAEPALQQLVLAADQFIVSREVTGDDGAHAQTTVIAGYHWFNDWGRDTMIAIPGLLLATGRSEEAGGVLRTFAHYLQDGLIPNNFPDHAGAEPGYNTADATLWFVLAIRAQAEATGDGRLIDELLPALRGIVEAHITGTVHGIGVDPADGLLQAREDGVQLTWMDAKVGDHVITPRAGKPVEVNALWYNVLRTTAGWCRARGEAGTADRYDALAGRVKASFSARYVRTGTSHLADVVDGPAGDDWSLRPNQLFAVSLPEPLVEGSVAAGVVDSCARSLLTSFGLRSLAPDQPGYTGRYAGGPAQRDGAYHEGTVWAWLMGPFVEAYLRVHGDVTAARTLLEPLIDHVGEAGLGSISEIFDGDPPHTARGCIAQAWSVAELLRVWRKLDGLGSGAPGS